MKPVLTLLLLILGLSLAPAVLAQSDDSARVKKDLGTVLALQGKPCGKVVKADKKGENDYEVTCEDGNRYRISIGADERVTVREVK